MIQEQDDVDCKMENWTKEDCLKNLRDIDEKTPGTITRDLFRKESYISERTWINYFGNFTQFKREAGLVPSKAEGTIMTNISRHASKDNLKELNEEKRTYEERYLKISNRNDQTILVGSDQHDLHCDPFYRRLFIEAASRIKPDYIVLGGDLFDFPEFSKYTNDPRDYKVIERINWVHEFLQDLRDTCPDTTMYLIAGNHEERLIRHLGESSSSLVTILSDLHGVTISNLLGLDKFEVNYISRLDLKAFNDADIKNELKKNYLIINDSILIHHYPNGFDYGLPGCNGHLHKHTVRNGYSFGFGSYDWHQLGSGHVRVASFCNAERWTNGFLIIHNSLKTKRSVMEYVDTTADLAVLGGRFYYRNEEELRFFI